MVLAAGANNGGKERASLRYAISDAEHFTRVMEGMGGVEPDRRILLKEPRVGDLSSALSQVKETVRQTRKPGDRVELIFYYSKHADETGLLLGGDRLTYQSLRDQLDAVQADVHITVLDACASGAITRIKGGDRQKAFLVDESSQMRGHAFLTSSSEDEVAQESDVIGGSYFTHHLVSGLRGAADFSGDGKVTLGEAYQHAFHETLAQTTDTRSSAQHPAYDINLAGTGDFVM
ncbi:MAG: caspase family protein, partial [Candidatus Latescibacteria bacterium]|nr:caspase family protein [Candidatus Latescibacterota bacterium]